MDKDDSVATAIRTIEPIAPAAAPKKKKNRARVVGIGLVAAALAGGLSWYFIHLGKESTDDAQVEGHVQPVSARVSGQVAVVRVKDNQQVKAGDILVELDKSDLEARAAAAQADSAAADAA